MNNNFKKDVLVTAILKDMYVTMWRMMGLRDVGEMPDKCQEGVSGKGGKGGIFVPYSLQPWNKDNDLIQLVEFASNPLSVSEFESRVQKELTKDGGTLLNQQGMASTYFMDELFDYHAKRIILEVYGQDVKTNDISVSLSPGWMTDKGGRIEVFSPMVVCLNNLELYTQLIMEQNRFLDLNFTGEVSQPIIGEGDVVLAYQPRLVLYNCTRYKGYSGTLLICEPANGENVIKIRAITLESATNTLLGEELEGDKYPQDSYWGKYKWEKGTTETVCTQRDYSFTRWGVPPSRIKTTLIKPYKSGIPMDLLRPLADEAFRSSKILDPLRREFPSKSHP